MMAALVTPSGGMGELFMIVASRRILLAAK
jgi:hypothetical protein